MKPQDIVFIVAIALLLWRRKPRYFIIAGLFCLFIAMPLFQAWVFFTAERLVWYAAAFLLVGIVLLMYNRRT